MTTKRQKKNAGSGAGGEREIQDGAAALTGGKEQRDWKKDTTQKLERFARTSQSASQTPQRYLQEEPAMQTPGGSRFTPLLSQGREREEEDMEEQQEEVRGLTQRDHNSRVRKSTEPTMSDLFREIAKCNSSISQVACQIEGLKEEISFIRHDLQKVSDRTSEVEQRVSNMEDTLPLMRRDVTSCSQAVSDLLTKTDDLENRLRRNNVRLIGVPEKVEGKDPDIFFENWIRNTIGADNLTPLYAVERAHRVPTRPGPPGRPPRPVLVKVLHYKDRDKILRTARELQDITLDGSKISFFPDYSIAVQKRRAQFMDIKRRLRTLGVSYSMLYPAKLRVAAMDSVQFFDSPSEALKWVDMHERQLRQQRDGQPRQD